MRNRWKIDIVELRPSFKESSTHRRRCRGFQKRPQNSGRASQRRHSALLEAITPPGKRQIPAEQFFDMVGSKDQKAGHRQWHSA